MILKLQIVAFDKTTVAHCDFVKLIVSLNIYVLFCRNSTFFLLFILLNLGWKPKTSLDDLLDSTLQYQHQTYSHAIKKELSKPST